MQTKWNGRTGCYAIPAAVKVGLDLAACRKEMNEQRILQINRGEQHSHNLMGIMGPLLNLQAHADIPGR
jgi:hypothetical protein